MTYTMGRSMYSHSFTHHVATAMMLNAICYPIYQKSWATA
jgi:hypothetical protein